MFSIVARRDSRNCRSFCSFFGCGIASGAATCFSRTMELAKSRRRLIVNADDFGASQSINAAVIDAHPRGILTTASLMVNGKAAEEAVELAKVNPRLGVGLHLSLCCGTSALRPSEI